MLNKIVVTTAALVTALALTPALAQQSSGSTDATKQESPAAKQAPTTGSAAPMTTQDLAELKGWPVYSSDGKKVGEVQEVMMNGANGKPTLRVETGGFLGIGAKTVTIFSDKFEKGANRVNLSMTSSEVSALPAADTN